ncbi:spore coat protein U domain-containing protein [Novilysobacter arseniciresistens]|uniref:spore coat protein U domain-containing protein n=1 Tax=Novilysobacter arseniciresistens TaxID=1385522 RepID=UPI0009DCD2BE|nr:spore coat protein U domain-containing protein [Lysobacter arseniciresistens]
MRAVLFCLLLLPSLCLAQTATECQLDAPVQLVLQSPAPDTMFQTVYGQVVVECPAGVEYRVEVQNAAPGGVVEFMAPGAPEPIPFSLRQSDTQQAWGAFNQGEAITGTGTGQSVSHPVEVGVNLNKLPASGNYTAILNVILISVTP